MQEDHPKTEPREKALLNLRDMARQADRELPEEQKKVAAAYLSGMMAAQQMAKESA